MGHLSVFIYILAMLPAISAVTLLFQYKKKYHIPFLSKFILYLFVFKFAILLTIEFIYRNFLMTHRHIIRFLVGLAGLGLAVLFTPQSPVESREAITQVEYYRLGSHPQGTPATLPARRRPR